MTDALWNTIFTLAGLPLAMPRQVVDLFACWKGFFGGSQNSIIWKTIMSCLMWSLQERNDRTFQDRDRLVEKLMDFFFKILLLDNFCEVMYF